MKGIQAIGEIPKLAEMDIATPNAIMYNPVIKYKMFLNIKPPVLEIPTRIY
jgi:hypothetical protein